MKMQKDDAYEYKPSSVAETSLSRTWPSVMALPLPGTNASCIGGRSRHGFMRFYNQVQESIGTTFCTPQPVINRKCLRMCHMQGGVIQALFALYWCIYQQLHYQQQPASVDSQRQETDQLQEAALFVAWVCKRLRMNSTKISFHASD